MKKKQTKKNLPQSCYCAQVTHIKGSARHFKGQVIFSNCTVCRPFLIRMATVEEDRFKKKKGQFEASDVSALVPKSSTQSLLQINSNAFL